MTSEVNEETKTWSERIHERLMKRGKAARIEIH